jgi:hypothetical protein
MIKPSEKMLEVEQERDLKLNELREKYEADLATINRCKEELDKVAQSRTYEYEQAYLAELRKYEENVKRFDLRDETQSLARQEAEVENGN